MGWQLGQVAEPSSAAWQAEGLKHFMLCLPPWLCVQFADELAWLCPELAHCA